MKKISLVVFGLMLALAGLFNAPQLAHANTSAIDQQYEGGTGSINILTGVRNAQTFKPTTTILEKVAVEIVNPLGTLHCTIREFSGGNWVTLVDGGTQNATADWMVFDFADLTVVPDQRYAIFLESEYPVSPSLWKYTSTSAYDRGYAIWQNTDKPDWDYNFKTWGYTPSASTPATDTGQVTTTGSTSTGTTGTTGTAPSATTSTSIDKPANLKAEYSSEVGKTGAKLTWTASKTTDITGYTIFRTETKGKNYAKVGTTDKKTVTYLDTTVAASKTYYYMVRAVKSTTESVNSNEASLAVPADAPPAIPTNLKIVSFDTSSINVSWDKNTDTSVTGYNISITNNGQAVAQASLAATSTSYTFSNLKSATPYVITLTAANAKGKTSAPASVSQTTAAAPQVPLWRWILGLFLIVILLGTGIYLIARNRKKKPKTKNS